MIAYWERGLEWMGERLVGHWCPSFTGPSSLHVQELSGQSNHGAFSGMDANTSWQTSGGKGALSFDGVDDYVLLPSKEKFQPVSGQTLFISAWINTRTTGNQTIVSHGRVGGYSFYIQFNFLEFAKAGVANTGGNASFTFLPTNTWTHVAVRNLVGSSVEFYINGELRRSASFGQTYTYANELRVGLTHNEGFPFSGLIDDVRIYDRALTAPEVRQLYDLGRGGGMLYQPPKRRSVFIAAGFRAYWHRRQSQVIGGGLR